MRKLAVLILFVIAATLASTGTPACMKSKILFGKLKR
jgi:hypothetical protein